MISQELCQIDSLPGVMSQVVSFRETRCFIFLGFGFWKVHGIRVYFTLGSSVASLLLRDLLHGFIFVCVSVKNL